MTRTDTWDYNSNIVPVEDLSAYSLYQVQKSLNEWKEQQELANAEEEYDRYTPHGPRKHTRKAERVEGQLGEQEYADLLNARERYNEGEEHTLEHEYRYLVSEQDFIGEGGVNSEAARLAAEAAEQAALEAEPNRIDQEYADGIGAVNQALADAEMVNGVMAEPVDPTNKIIEMDPVSISNPEEGSSARLGGINAFKSAPASVRTIKNQSINI
jgi:hypothetical protein